MMHHPASHSLPAKHDAEFSVLDAIPVQSHVVEVVAPRTDTLAVRALRQQHCGAPKFITRE